MLKGHNYFHSKSFRDNINEQVFPEKFKNHIFEEFLTIFTKRGFFQRKNNELFHAHLHI